MHKIQRTHAATALQLISFECTLNPICVPQEEYVLERQWLWQTRFTQVKGYLISNHRSSGEKEINPSRSFILSFLTFKDNSLLHTDSTVLWSSYSSLAETFLLLYKEES